MSKPITLLIYYLAAVNLLALLVYGIDKALSKRKGCRRVPERTLLWLARIGGGAGCWLGMLLFRHKTQHKQFKILVPVWTVLWVLLLVFYFTVYLPYQL